MAMRSRPTGKELGYIVVGAVIGGIIGFVLIGGGLVGGLITGVGAALGGMPYTRRLEAEKKAGPGGGAPG